MTSSLTAPLHLPLWISILIALAGVLALARAIAYARLGDAPFRLASSLLGVVLVMLLIFLDQLSLLVSPLALRLSIIVLALVGATMSIVANFRGERTAMSLIERQ